MRKLTAFNHVSLDGYFTGANGDFSWARRGNDAEFNAFTADNARGEAQLLFGRVTYDMMAGYWSSAAAITNDPKVAASMNRMSKVVFSKTLDQATWSNTTLIKSDLPAAVRDMKNQQGNDLLIFGSGKVVAQLAAHGLIDEYQFIVNPIVLGSGRTLFHGVNQPLNLTLINSRIFGNGKVFLSYSAA